MLDFPNSPTTGQTFPTPAVPGTATWQWDGAKWLPFGMVPPAAVNPPGMVTTGNQTLTGGFAVTPYNNGNGSGTFTPNPMNGNYQSINNNGTAFTINPPTTDCAIDLLVQNTATGGTITMGAGWTYASANYGDPYTTTSGAKFIFSLRRIAGVSTFTFKALQ